MNGRPTSRQRPEIPRDLADSYATQETTYRRDLASGRRHLGWKLALTDQSGRDAFGAIEPVRGHLYEDMSIPTTSAVDLSRLARPLIEMELVFTLARSIEPLGTIDAVLDALDSVAVGIEIVDLGATGLPSLQELVALNAYAGRIAVGPRRRLPRDESREILAGLGEGELTLGKEVVPIDPNLVHQAVLNLSWLAASAWTSGRRLLGEGDVIFSGSLTGMRPLNHGASVRARIAGLGDLRLRTG